MQAPTFDASTLPAGVQMEDLSLPALQNNLKKLHLTRVIAAIAAGVFSGATGVSELLSGLVIYAIAIASVSLAVYASLEASGGTKQFYLRAADVFTTGVFGQVLLYFVVWTLAFDCTWIFA
ncbi:MAG: uncharacterized protein KVP18_002530 [Porospora cf. gigantea A]|uniref:uncharacterized protein n=1 Tax=Porospora cf. gigantea A TaxID=2853593 RepID=UPI00355A8432|nr:MAG: hypothetical protein KVP18_002530 [Porospora cf. gigantea A]